MNWVFWFLMCVWVICQIYNTIKVNKENSLFEHTVFQMYLKEKGLSDEDIDAEIDEYARQYNRLWHAIGTKAITEKQYLDKIAEYRKKNHLK